MFDWIWFEDGPSAGAALGIYGLGLAISCLLALIGSAGSRNAFKEFILGAAFLFGCGVLVVNVVSVLISTDEKTLTYADGRVATKTFGLRSDKEYPLVVGSRIGGSSIASSAYGSAGFFSARAYVRTESQPASAISVSFTVKEKSYILEVPVSKITFIQSTTAHPTVSMHINADTFNGITYNYAYNGHRCGLRNFWFVCFPKLAQTNVEIDADTTRRGLAPIVGDYLDSAVFTLTPAMYKEILGSP